MGLFSKSASPQDASPQDTFARHVLAVVVASPRVAAAHYDAQDFAIVYRRHANTEESGRIYLHNTFRETQGLPPPERESRIQRLVDIMVDPPDRDESWADVRAKLRPVIRGVAFGLAMPGATTVDNPVRLLSRPFQPYLVELVVVDEPTSMAYVTTPRLAEWGVTEDEIFAAARQNLVEPAGRISTSADDIDRGPKAIRFVDTGDAYFTSMLLLDGFLAGLADHVGGRPVAFIPDKDTLLVIADNESTLTHLYPMVEEDFNEATRSISPVGYTVDNEGRVHPYHAAPETALAQLAHRAEIILASGEYGAQKQALDNQHERDGTDLFVATVLTGRRPDESVFSVAVWSSDVDTLLPEADYLALFGPAGEPITVPFDVAIYEASLLPEPGYDPVRYRVATWPSEPVMDRLRSLAVDP